MATENTFRVGGLDVADTMRREFALRHAVAVGAIQAIVKPSAGSVYAGAEARDQVAAIAGVLAALDAIEAEYAAFGSAEQTEDTGPEGTR